jgi:hypothetical protein
MFGLGAWFAKSALMSSPVGGFLKMVPQKVWIGIAIAAALLGAYLWHQHKVHQLINAALAAALSLRGPGAAASRCGPVSGPRPSTSTGQPGHSAPAAGAPPAGVLAEDWATVPWRWLVNVVQQHDDVTSEAQAWRNQYARQHELHIRSQQPH